MKDCVFCMIARGDIPAKAVYSDDLVMAFDDMSPQAPVHTLIIPRGHYAHIGDDVPTDVAVAVFAAIPKVAEAKGLAESGYRVIINTGPDAQQTVHHLHVHLMGGRAMSEGMVHFSRGR
ncbi:MAG: histidine triad nucleotide-binding protein [Actinobacteria bacterium]|nr:histidine triad nucleotide-binding protein [Actinomycetota bacterium]